MRYYTKTILFSRTFIVDTMQIKQHHLKVTDFFLATAPFVLSDERISLINKKKNISLCSYYNQKLFVYKFWIFCFYIIYVHEKDWTHEETFIQVQSQIRQYHIYTPVLKAYINLFILIHVPFMSMVTKKLLSSVLSLFISKQIYFHCFYKLIYELYELHKH